MMSLNRSLLLACVGLIAFVGCGSDDKHQNTGPYSGPDQALSATDCYLGLAASGTTYAGFGCSGTSQDSSVTGIGPNSFDDVRMALDISLNAPPAIGQLDLASLTIRVPVASGGYHIWNAPVDSCKATAIKSATDTDFNWVYYRIDIACTQPAAPATDNPEAPLALGQFSIVTFFAP